MATRGVAITVSYIAWDNTANVGKTGDELTASKAEFDKLDADKDGKLTKKEFTAGKKHKSEDKK